MLEGITLEDREKALERCIELDRLINQRDLSPEEVQKRLDGLDEEYCNERFNLIEDYMLKFDIHTNQYRLRSDEEVKIGLEEYKRKKCPDHLKDKKEFAPWFLNHYIY